VSTASAAPKTNVRPLPKPAVPDLTELAEEAARRGTEFLFSIQRDDARWCAELESNPTITAEYVFLAQILGLDLGDRKERIVRHLVGLQSADGSWGIARHWDGDVSTTAEVYLALRLLGQEPTAAPLIAAEKYIRRNGGLETMRIFTRIFFAMFGLFPWDAVPSIPPEFMLLPPSSPVNPFRLSSWARCTMVPLFIIFHHRPLFALPNGKSADNDWLDSLWLDPTNKHLPYAPSLPKLVKESGLGWRSLFGAADAVLTRYEKVRIGPLRELALKKATEYVLSRQEKSGDWGGIFPPMLNGLIALTLQGYGLDSEPIRRGLAALESFAWEDDDGYRIQACVSPVWDTVLATISLIDAGAQPADPKLRDAIQWVVDRQVNVDYGDWKVYRPELVSGGWSFEYFNTWYPDVDDTAAVLLAILKQDPGAATGEPMRRAVEWTLGMQNKDGGWAAFDVDNDKQFLTQIPFSDMDSLCDPSSPDVTGRMIEAFGLLLELAAEKLAPELRARVEDSIAHGIQYLRATQEVQGSWFGRWGVNYVYGTSNVLCGLARVGMSAQDPMVERGLAWLKHVQSPSGGWGESLASYKDKSWMGRGEPTASQTGWAVMGLVSFLPANDTAIERGVRWLVEHQVAARPQGAKEGGVAVPEPKGFTWDETHPTGTGFPNYFYLRYHLYRHYFPMMALGRYLQAARGE
jgi:squalene-hopene/tetraprenyl-beta-curcumene cyclase